MKLNKKTERLIKRPQNMSKEEEIAYILKKADENCDHIEIRKILNVSNT